MSNIVICVGRKPVQSKLDLSVTMQRLQKMVIPERFYREYGLGRMASWMIRVNRHRVTIIANSKVSTYDGRDSDA